MKHFSALALVIALLALLPGAALAQDAGEGYGAVAGVGDSAEPGSNAATRVADTSGGSLPFTGLDLGLIVGAGGLLVVTGLALRRLRTE